MNIFISWSGDASCKVAEALRKWLPTIIDRPQCWMSAIDIPDGKRWNNELLEQLHLCDFGILVITPQNKTAPWLLFEAGALSKNIKEGRVIPYLVLLTKQELPSPLSQFQALAANKKETFRLVKAINNAMHKPLDSEIIQTRFDGLWPSLHNSIRDIEPEVMKDISSMNDRQDKQKSDHSELEKLHKELSETKNIIKELVNSINSSFSSFTNNNKIIWPAMSELEGPWRDEASETFLYIKVVDGKLVAPYCYGGNNELVAEYYDWRRIGEYWFVRFKWFKKDFRGFAFYKLVSKDKIEGRWWLSDDINIDTTLIENFDGFNIRGGTTVTWHRISKTKTPKWANDYFNKVKQNKCITMVSS